MSRDLNQEIEAKFYVKNIQNIEQNLKQLRAQIVKPRIFEVNYRYDTPEHKLSTEYKVLRIRKDSKNWITFKGPGVLIDGVRIRKEIEISISDIKKAQLILHALGYQLFQSYEKYRTVYTINNSLIMVDELPFGIFVEIESADINSLKNCANILGLNWELKIGEGYLGIYKNLSTVYDICFGDLTFKKFVGSPDMLQKINIFPADK